MRMARVLQVLSAQLPAASQVARLNLFQGQFCCEVLSESLNEKMNGDDAEQRLAFGAAAVELQAVCEVPEACGKEMYPQ